MLALLQCLNWIVIVEIGVSDQFKKGKLPLFLFTDIPILVTYEIYYRKDMLSSLKVVHKNIFGSRTSLLTEKVLLIDISPLTAICQEQAATN